MESKTLVVNGVSFRVQLDGKESSPPLLLINSLSTTLSMWDAQVPRFAGHFRVIRYDQRGHGDTSAPPGPYSIDDLGNDALGIMDALGVDSADLCGISLGGMISMWLAINAPDRVRRLAVGCTSAYFGPAEFWRDRADVVLKRGMDTLFDPLMSRWFTSHIDERNPQAGDLLRSMLNSCDPQGYAQICGVLGETDLRSQLATISAPVLVLAGAEDPATPPETAVSLFQEISDAALYVIPGASHLANLEQPELFTDAVVEHLVGPPKDRGMKVRTEVLGREHVERATSATTEFTSGFQDFISRYAWGEIWNRPGLDRRSRSIITLTTLIALGHLNELSFHIPAALRNGLTTEEISEIILQCSIYAGVPAANSAFTRANDILKSLK